MGTDDEGRMDGGRVVRLTVDEPPGPIDKQSSPVQGSVVTVGSTKVVGPRVVGVTDNAEVDVALGRDLDEALTQSRSVHPNGSVEVGLAGINPGDVGGVVDNDPVADVVLERELKEALRQRRSEQPNGKVIEDGCDVGAFGLEDPEVGNNEMLMQAKPVQPVVEVLPLATEVERVGREPLTVKSPVRDTIVGLEAVVLVKVLDEEVLPIDDAVLVRETVQPPSLRQTSTQRISVHIVVDAGVVRLVDGKVGVPVREGLETARVGEDELDDAGELGIVFGLVLSEPELLDVVVICPSELEGVVPGCTVLREEDVVAVKETVQPLKFRQASRHSRSVHVVVETKLSELVIAGVGTPVTSGLAVTGLDDEVLDVVVVCPRELGAIVPGCSALLEEEDVPVNETVHPLRSKQALRHSRSVQVVVETEPNELVIAGVDRPVICGLVIGRLDSSAVDVVEVLGRDRVHLVPRPKQAFTHRRSVHVVLGIIEEPGVVTLVRPVTVGELAGNNDPDEYGSELVKDTVHPKPRFKQAFTHRRSVQVAVVTGLVVAGFDVAEVVLPNCVNPDDNVVMGDDSDVLAVDKLDAVLEDVCDGEAGAEADDAVVLKPIFDVPIPVEEEVNVVWLVGEEDWLAVLVMPDPDDPLEETVGLATLDEMKVDPEDMMVADVIERADNTVDEDAVDTKAGMLVVQLLGQLLDVPVEEVGLDVVVEQPGPEQTETQDTPLQDVVQADDKLETLDETDLEEVTSVVGVGLVVRDELPEVTND
ncbi:MAG: hypothetical protein Q9221_003244 [Calogaya cf. arnoldii]